MQQVGIEQNATTQWSYNMITAEHNEASVKAPFIHIC